MLTALDALHRRARREPALHRLAIISRVLLAVAFIPTGMVKLLGHRFTTLPVDHPVGAFFEAMYQTGYYWNFLGTGQVLAGILILIPATTTLGAVCYFPIVLNITVLTWSIGFAGTTYITALMLIASLFLLCWDWDRLRSILAPPVSSVREVIAPPSRLEQSGYVLGTASALGVLLALRRLLPAAAILWLLAAGALAVVLVLVAWVRTLRHPHSAAAAPVSAVTPSEPPFSSR